MIAACRPWKILSAVIKMKVFSVQKIPLFLLLCHPIALGRLRHCTLNYLVYSTLRDELVCFDISGSVDKKSLKALNLQENMVKTILNNN